MHRRNSSMFRCKSKNSYFDVIVGRSSMDYAQNVHRIKKDLEIENKTANIGYKIITDKIR